jgi:hypothetical protein
MVPVRTIAIRRISLGITSSATSMQTQTTSDTPVNMAMWPTYSQKRLSRANSYNVVTLSAVILANSPNMSVLALALNHPKFLATLWMIAVDLLPPFFDGSNHSILLSQPLATNSTLMRRN